MSPRVSLAMIVKNEEANLPGCFASIADLVDEIVIVDTGSTDLTKVIATGNGARIFEFPWIDDFSAARNESLRHATGDWIFWLDADDRIDELNRGRLKALFASLGDDNVAYSMKCVCQSPTDAGSSTILEHTRLFRRHPEIRWTSRIHEQIMPSIERLGGVQRPADVVIQHIGYQDPTQRRQKLQRDLRLLQAENSQSPDDPLTLFHLGWTWHLLGNAAEALPVLGRCLEVSAPNLAIVRKTLILVVRSLRQVGDADQAMKLCQMGRARYPHDAELCLHEGQLRKERGEFTEAEACLLQLFELPADPYVAIGDDPGLRGYKGRCALAEVYRDSGRYPEAEVQYRRIVAEHPSFIMAWMCLADVLLIQERWSDAEQLAQEMSNQPEQKINATLLRARIQMFRRDFVTARRLAEEGVSQSPGTVWPREVLTHILMTQGDWAAAERALRDLLTLQPNNAAALANLAVAQRELAQLSK